MRARLLRYAKRHPILALGALVCAVGLLWFALDTAVAWSGYAAFTRRLHSLSTTPTGDRSRRVAFTFPFRSAMYRVEVPLDKNRVAASAHLDTSGAFARSGAVRAAYLRAFVREQSEEPLVDELAARMREIRGQLGLDDDEYVELLARLVQNMDYGTSHAQVYPVYVTAAKGRSVCSDRSILLAALLLHEGYDTGIYIFDSQGHAGAAVRGLGPGYLRTGYSFIETTRFAYVSEMTRSLRAAGPVFAPPQLVTVGGTRRYTSDVESDFIAGVLERAKDSSVEVPGRSVAWDFPPAALVFGAQVAMPAYEGDFAHWVAEGRDRRAFVYARLTAAGPNR